MRELNRSRSIFSLTLVSTIAMTAVMSGCSGDDGATRDSGNPSDAAPAPDHSPGGADGVVLAADTRRVDAAPPESTPDLTTATFEAGAPATIEGTVGLDPSISCVSSPALDCKGTLLVGAVDKPVAPPQSKLLASQVVSAVDLAASPVKFTLTGLRSGASVFISAMLVESGPIPNPPLPQTGDLVVQPKPIVLAPGANSANLQLDARWK